MESADLVPTQMKHLNWTAQMLRVAKRFEMLLNYFLIPTYVQKDFALTFQYLGIVFVNI